MKQLPSSLSRPLIRITYCLPLLFGIVMLIHASVPHVFYIYMQDNVPNMGEDQSLFGLMSSTWKLCTAWIKGTAEGTAEGTPNAFYFSYMMNTAVVISWIAMVLYALTAIPAAICSFIAFSFPPTSRVSNQAKRWLQLFCPNRVLYVLALLLPLIPTSFSLFLQFGYRKLMHYDMTVHYQGISDLALAAILTAISLAAFLLLLPAQRDEQMDMYRLCKPKDKAVQ